VEGLHDTAETVGRTDPPPVTVPPVVVTLMLLPVVEEPMALLTVIGRLVTPVARVTFTTATTPLAMTLEFMPEITHEYAPEDEKQLNVLEAALVAAPAEAEMEATLLAGYVRVHCKAASLPDADVNVRFSDAVPPAPAVTEFKVKESVCPKSGYSDANKTIAAIRTTSAPRSCFSVKSPFATLTA